MCVANTCNHSHRIVKISSQHLTVEELSRGGPEKLEGITIRAQSTPPAKKDMHSCSSSSTISSIISKAKELTVVRQHPLPVETRSSSSRHSTTDLTVDEDKSWTSTASLPSDDDVAGAGAGCLKILSQANSLARMYCSNSCMHQKHVEWDSVEFRTHNTVLGNNPAVSFGAPIAIGDELLRTDCFRIDKYEELRPERRTAAELRVPWTIRERTLMSEGYSRNEILRATFEMERIRNRRRRMARYGPIEQLRNVLFLRRRRVLGRPNTL